MALNRSDKSRILRRYFPGMTRNSEMSTEPNLVGHRVSLVRRFSVVLTSGRDVGSGCQPKRCAAAFATRRARAVAIILPSVSTK